MRDTQSVMYVLVFEFWGVAAVNRFLAGRCECFLERVGVRERRFEPQSRGAGRALGPPPQPPDSCDKLPNPYAHETAGMALEKEALCSLCSIDDYMIQFSK